MIPITLEELARRTGGKPIGSAVVSGFATDSRYINPGDLFLAIRGARVDGHTFVPQARRNGAAATLCEEPIAGPHVIVPDLIEALGELGRSYRQEFQGPVIGVTGSAGKTTTKELIYSACSPLGRVLKTEGNRNSEYTSPLIWAELAEDHKAAVIEMGMRGMRQIEHLASIASPQIGVVTSIGSSHVEMVGSRLKVAEAKAELLEALPENGLAILPLEDDFYDLLASKAPCPIKTFGSSVDADCRVVGSSAESWTENRICLELDGVQHFLTLPVIGRHQAHNAAAALLAAAAAGVDPAQACSAMEQAELPPMRLQPLVYADATILLDSYNASPDSTTASVMALAEGPCHGRRMAVLGEMMELGEASETGHRRVGKAVAEAQLDLVCLTGGETRFIENEAVSRGFPKDRITSLNRLDLSAVQSFIESMQPGDVLLIKGSRSLELEKALPKELR